MKFNVLGMDSATDDTVGNSDMEPIWNLQPREGMALHWDGLNTSIREVVLSSAIGDGARRRRSRSATLKRLENYLRKHFPRRSIADSSPTRLTGPGGQGRSRSTRTGCAECHDFGGKRTGTVIPVAEVGTDPERHKLWREEAARRYNDYAKDYPWKFNNFRATDGYSVGPARRRLDPGTVPAQRLGADAQATCSSPPAQAPQGLLSRQRPVTTPTRSATSPTCPRTTAAASSSTTPASGPTRTAATTYGTDLSADDKKALIEYLKTL